MTLGIAQFAIAALAACLASVAACAPAAAPTPIELSNVVDAELEVEAIAQPMSFIVNFRPSHALGRAQFLQSAGRHDEAERLVEGTFQDDAALRGLCFDRFTLSGAEIVLNVCAPSPWETPQITQRRWLEQLGATPGVAYVERNLVVQREQAAGTAS